MTFYYENSNGQTVNLYGDGVLCDPTPLFKWEYEASTYNSKIYKLSQSLTTYKLDATAYEKSARNSLFNIPVIDRENLKPGKLWFDDWYMIGYLTASESSGFLRYLNVKDKAKYKLTFTTDDPVWHRDADMQYFVLEATEGADLDYSHDFEYDYGFMGSYRVENESNFDCDILIRAFGKCDSVSIGVGENIYSVDITVPDGGYLEIDTYNKTVELVEVSGVRTDVFSSIGGTYQQDSGSYIFQKVKPGINNISWDGSFNFDVTLKERRAEPRWS
jgi:hypothetical protein